MTQEFSLLSAFLVGLLGSLHCLGMCGGIVGALTFGLKEDVRRTPFSLFPYQLLYNIGRIASYAIAGALMGWIGSQALDALTLSQARLVGRLLSGGFMVALGLYLAGWWQGLVVVEKLGAHLWRKLEPLGRRVMPVRTPWQALMLGLVWGWLPCGLVYSTLSWSLVSGSAADGAWLMAAFGLGTLPMLLAMGAAARGLRDIVRRVWVRRTAGILIMLFGFYTLFVPGAHVGHAAHTEPAGLHSQHSHP
ncbi:MAG: sulfite exporter TauE/SafE family protein [Pseudomonadota bacterium]|mgnify:CR=1 FL=1